MLGREMAQHHASGAARAPVWLLDGFPRSVAQLDAVTSLFGFPFAAALLVTASDADIAARQAARGVRPEDPPLEQRAHHDQSAALWARAQALGEVLCETIENTAAPEAAVERATRILAAI